MSALNDNQTGDCEEPARDGNRCEYCHAPLDRRFYFCVNCGRPFQDVERVLPPTRPPPLTNEILIRNKAPMVWRLFWSFAILLVLTAFLSLLCFPGRQDLAFFFTEAAIFSITSIYAALNFGTLLPQFKTLGIFHWAALLGLTVLAPLLAVNYGWSNWLFHAGDAGHGTIYEALKDAHVSERAIVFGFCVLPALTEEIAFRGLMQRWLLNAVKPSSALLLTAALFTIMHFSILSAPYLFLVGLLLGWVAYKTGSLYPSMLLHFLHNFVVVEFFTRG